MTTDYQQQDNAPYDQLEAEWRQIQPAWGVESTSTLRNVLKKNIPRLVKDAQAAQTLENNLEFSPHDTAWELLSYFTRDLRLANLSDLEFEYAKYYLDLAGDCLEEGHPASFMAALRRCISLTELSQSKKGFLRRRQNTITKEERNITEPSQKKLMGGKRDNG